MSRDEVLDVSDLPDFAFGNTGVVWWGVIMFILIEATMLVLCMLSYFYLRSQAAQWPPVAQFPALTLPSINLALMLISVGPMIWTEKAARQLDKRRIRIGLVISVLFGCAFIVLRVFELSRLGVRWDSNAYGSIVWLMVNLHTVHLFSEVLETVVIAVLMFRRDIKGKYFSDVEDNALYWYFIVAIWVPVYAVIFISPRLL